MALLTKGSDIENSFTLSNTVSKARRDQCIHWKRSFINTTSDTNVSLDLNEPQSSPWLKLGYSAHSQATLARSKSYFLQPEPITTSMTLPQPTTISSTTRTIFVAHPIPQLLGFENRFMLLHYPPAVSSPPHTHPVDGVNCIIQGTVKS